MRPGRAKASGDKRYEYMLLPLQGVLHRYTIPQGVALGYELLPLQGVLHRCAIPQGVALGYELLPLQGEALNTEARRHGDAETWRKILCFRRYGEFFSLNISY